MSVQNTESDHKDKKRFVLAGKALSVSAPCIMGVLNVTPDSFYDGGRHHSVDRALRRIEQMVEEGADIIDTGGESTRPGSDPVTLEEEIDRVIPVIEKAVRAFPATMFSIDTTKIEVARRALESGVHMINDVSGLQADPAFADLSARYEAILVIMHSQGPPKTMQDRPEYTNVVREVNSFLEKKAELARSGGVRQVVIDPGIGFGKTLAHNLEIMHQLPIFTQTGHPVLIGVSRKSMIGHLLADEQGPRHVDNRLAGTLALQYHALMSGVAIIRAHDVREARDILEVYQAVSQVNA